MDNNNSTNSINNTNNRYNRIYAEINLDHIKKNMEAMAANLPAETKIIGVVKTDGYGHGSVPVAKAIDPYVWGYATATLEEAVILREHRIIKPVLVLGSAPVSSFRTFLDYGIRPSIFEIAKAEELSALAVRAGKKAPIHIAVDTGMSRIGYLPTQESAEEAGRIAALPGITMEGLYTHFSGADEAGRETTTGQYERYGAFVRMLEMLGVDIPIKHCANSAAIIDYNEMNLDAVRAGIAMYGLYPSEQMKQSKVRLCPAMELFSFVTYIKEIEADTPVSYGSTFVSSKRMRIATISAGYGDGYPRNLSGKGEILIHGKRAPILGRICMDQLMVDVSHIPEARQGDRVTLIGREEEAFIPMEEAAKTCGGFHYEIPCVLGKRVPRVYISGQRIVGSKDYNHDKYEDFLR